MTHAPARTHGDATAGLVVVSLVFFGACSRVGAQSRERYRCVTLDMLIQQA
jgi:hypothetical protein